MTDRRPADPTNDELPCGRSASQVWDDAAAGDSVAGDAVAGDAVAGDAVAGDAVVGRRGLDEHERSCPYCSAIAAERFALDPAAQALLERSPQPPARLLDAVMRTVRTELRAGLRLPMPTAVGAAYVLDHVVARAVLTLLDAEPAVVARRCRVLPSADEAQPGWHVELTLAVSYDYFSRRGEDELRTRVRVAVQTWFGAPAVGVDIDIVDVFSERPSVRSTS